MTGPEHYAKAEELLEVAHGAERMPVAAMDALLAAAQVHATLALAAVTSATRVTYETPNGETCTYLDSGALS